MIHPSGNTDLPRGAQITVWSRQCRRDENARDGKNKFKT